MVNSLLKSTMDVSRKYQNEAYIYTYTLKKALFPQFPKLRFIEHESTDDNADFAKTHTE